MTWDMPEEAKGLVDSLFQASLPQQTCAACHRIIPRRRPRITIRASWRPEPDHLCPQCWRVICEWAARFAHTQLELPLN